MSHRINFVRSIFPVVMFFIFSACSDITELKIDMDDTLRLNVVTPLKIVRSGTGSGEWDLGDKDGFNYSFSSYPAGKFQVEVVNGKDNDYCRTSESNEVTDGTMHSEITRDMLIKEKDAGEITIAIACHKQIYRFAATDSVINMQLVLEDADEQIRDTVVFKIIR